MNAENNATAVIDRRYSFVSHAPFEALPGYGRSFGPV
jgi:hypothetical protein